MQPPTTGNAAARDRFEVARARYEVNDYATAARELARLAQDFPNDPIIPYAELYAGMAAFRQGEREAAKEHLGKLNADPQTPDDVRRKAQLYLGIVQVIEGDAAGGRALLEPLEGRVDDREEDIERLSPLGSDHTTLTGRYRVLLPSPLHDRGAYRALNTPQDAAAA